MVDTFLERLIQGRSFDARATSAAPRLLKRLGYVIESRGSRLRAQACGIAVLLTVSGRIDATNVELVAEHLVRFIGLRGPLIVEVRATFESRCCKELLDAFDEDCRHERVVWVLVGEFDGEITNRLPLVSSVETGSRYLFDHCRRVAADAAQPGDATK